MYSSSLSFLLASLCVVVLAKPSPSPQFMLNPAQDQFNSIVGPQDPSLSLSPDLFQPYSQYGRQPNYWGASMYGGGPSVYVGGPSVYGSGPSMYGVGPSPYGSVGYAGSSYIPNSYGYPHGASNSGFSDYGSINALSSNYGRSGYGQQVY